jgi:hypothetical protein
MTYELTRPFFKCHKRNIGIFQTKMKNKKYHTAVTIPKYHTAVTIPKSNIKIDTLTTEIHHHSLLT